MARRGADGVYQRPPPRHGGEAGGFGPCGPLHRRAGVQGKGVDRAGKFCGEGFTDHPMPNEQPHIGEGLANEHNPEIRLGPGGHFVLSALVAHLKVGVFEPPR